MEFRFNVNEIFKQPIIEIGHSLIPAGFKGDRRQLWDTISKVTDVVNAMGSASATAQGLTKSITTSDRLRNSDQQTLYLLIDQYGNQGRGAVTGMLKTGKKGLYVFDRDGHHYQVQSPCILDFYVHESRQRSGFGKQIFEYMLQREAISPEKLAIDRPSDKFLGFLQKHYKLQNPIRQMNNFVVFDGFFPKTSESDRSPPVNGTSLHGSNGLQSHIISTPYGRYGAPRPPCSMGQIIHNQSSTVSPTEPTGETPSPRPVAADDDEPAAPVTQMGSKLDRPQTLSLQQNENDEIPQVDQFVDDLVVEEDHVEPVLRREDIDDIVDRLESNIEKVKLSEMQMHRQRQRESHIGEADEDDASARNKRSTPSHLTDQGYFDLKFYHNKLW